MNFASIVAPVLAYIDEKAKGPVSTATLWAWLLTPRFMLTAATRREQEWQEKETLARIRWAKAMERARESE